MYTEKAEEARDVQETPVMATNAEGTLARLGARIWNYIGLTRPRVLNLVLLTAPAGCVLGRDSWPHPFALLGVLVGCALIGAGCGALNAWWERERDAKMDRTRNRPLPAGRLMPKQALVFGLWITLLGLASLYGVGGILPVVVGALTVLHYFFVYTVWLKPRSPHNIVVGSVAGAAAPVIADAAVNGEIGVWSLVLFAIVFLWQPPHVWAITLYRKHEYEAAGFPMMPSVVGDVGTRWRQLAYAALLFPVTLLPWAAGILSSVYACVAIFGGSLFISQILRAIRLADYSQDRRVFVTSIGYLALLFAEMIVERIIF